MQIVTPALVKNKKVLLRYDMDVALRKSSVVSRQTSDEMEVAEDFKLRAGLETLKLCIENASKVIIIGHLGRGNPPELSAKPIQEWLEQTLGKKVDFAESLEEAAASENNLVLLENIRFFHGEVEGDIDFAHRLAKLGEVYVNEAFSSYNPAASTTMVPTLLPHAAGLRFVREVGVLGEVRDNPKKPLVVIIGGVKVADKLPVIEIMAKKADAVLVGGKLVQELNAGPASSLPPALPANILVGKLNEAGTDIAPETTESWRRLIMGAKMIIWNGPLGKFEDPKNEQSAIIARMILDSQAEIVVGGGDTVSLLGSLGILEEYQKKAFVSVGGGACLKFLAEGTLPTIEALR